MFNRMFNRYLSYVIIYFLCFYREIFNQTCPNKTSSSPPILNWDRTSNRTQSGIEWNTICVVCCFDGYTNVDWKFRKYNGIWEDLPDKAELDNDNRQMCLREPIKLPDDGKYRCSATDNDGRNKTFTIDMYFLKDDDNKTISLDNVYTRETSFSIGSEIVLKCKAHSYIPNTAITVSWQSPQAAEVNTTILTVANRSGETNPDLVDAFSTLRKRDARIEDSGLYRCIFQQGNLSVQLDFPLRIVDNNLNVTVLLSIIFSSIIITTIISALWFQRLSIIVIYKTYFDLFPTNESKDIDVSLVYFEEDGVSAQTAFAIVKVLEKYKFRCWLFDRDKQYGEEIMANQRMIMNKSHTVLVLLSQKLIASDLLINLSSTQSNPTVQRLYIFNPNTKKVMKTVKELDPLIERWLKKELSLQSVIRPHNYNWNPDENPKLHKLFTWIISSLPSTVIRHAKEELLGNANNK